MNTKFVIIRGLAFSEEGDMRKLKNYAKEGWILDGIVGGFFYRLRKGEPRDLDYTVDYHSKVDGEYFNLFAAAGWTKVLSVSNTIHIFSAPAGTKPIYSDKQTMFEKYTGVRAQMGRWALYSFIVLVAVMAAVYFKPEALILRLVMVVCIVLFIFGFFPYLGFGRHIRKLRDR